MVDQDLAVTAFGGGFAWNEWSLSFRTTHKCKALSKVQRGAPIIFVQSYVFVKRKKNSDMKKYIWKEILEYFNNTSQV